jgi:hypothetical protein
MMQTAENRRRGKKVTVRMFVLEDAYQNALNRFQNALDRRCLGTTTSLERLQCSRQRPEGSVCAPRLRLIGYSVT